MEELKDVSLRMFRIEFKEQTHHLCRQDRESQEHYRIAEGIEGHRRQHQEPDPTAFVSRTILYVMEPRKLTAREEGGAAAPRPAGRDTPGP